MNSHKNARLTAPGRAELVRRVIERGQSASTVATSFGVCVKTVRKWVARFEAEGEAGLQDRSSRPRRLHRPTPPEVADRIVALRRERWTGKRIAAELGVSPATVSRILRRLGLSRMRDLEPAEPARRYERDRPGEMIHIDIKKLGRFERPGHRATGARKGNRNRGAGWDFVHVAIDDATRLAYVEVLPDERKETATAFLTRALAWFAARGVAVERVMTDNGSCYRAKLFGLALNTRSIRHIRTRPYTPKTNGKAERFIQTLMREWAYAHSYPSADARSADLPRWLDWYNTGRPHSALNASTPASAMNNLMRSHT